MWNDASLKFGAGIVPEVDKVPGKELCHSNLDLSSKSLMVMNAIYNWVSVSTL